MITLRLEFGSLKNIRNLILPFLTVNNIPYWLQYSTIFKHLSRIRYCDSARVTKIWYWCRFKASITKYLNVWFEWHWQMYKTKKYNLWKNLMHSLHKFPFFSAMCDPTRLVIFGKGKHRLWSYNSNKGGSCLSLSVEKNGMKIFFTWFYHIRYPPHEKGILVIN